MILKNTVDEKLSAAQSSARCPLCSAESDSQTLVHCATVSTGETKSVWIYFQCKRCALVHRDQSSFLDHMAERAHYSLHQNSDADAGYREFLRPTVDLVAERIPIGARGLDFGAGPVPVLAQTLHKLGFTMRSYDPYFTQPRELAYIKHDANQDSMVADQQIRFAFITCTEAAEHFCDPSNEFDWMHSALEDRGWLVVRTQLLKSSIDFGNWYYRRDPTHVVFYSEDTFEWLAAARGWRVTFPLKNHICLQKS